MADRVDPIIEQLRQATPRDRELFAMLAALIEHGDDKPLRTIEMTLRSLMKETQRSPIPWEYRQPGNFEPPSD
ncbi:MAG TPA: hypothetical protein VEI24_05845 [Nitrospiria bacterium]|nr:hypothetical protein [Nitrospiria bacterium]